MTLTTLLQTSERNANRGILLLMWILSAVGIAAALALGGHSLIYWGAAQIGLIALPTLLHWRRVGEQWVKYLLAVILPGSLLIMISLEQFMVVPWPFWFLCLAVGAFYMDRGVAAVSTIASFAALAAGLVLSPPQQASLINNLIIGGLCMAGASGLMFTAAGRFRRVMASLDKAAEMERISAELESALQTLGQSAGGVRAVVRELEQESARAQAAVAESVEPAVRSVMHGFRDQEMALQRGAEALQTIAATVDQVARGAEQQAEQTSQSMNDVTALAESAAGMSALVDSVSTDAGLASDMAAEGGELARQNREAFEAFQAMVEETSARLLELGSHSQKIGQVVVLIQEIANQTSLLSLNAAIEAARAGEQGRGFAVVADEVRKLADRSSAATREISELIGQVAGGIEGSLTAMAETRSSVAAGAGQSARTAEVLDKIREATGRTAGQLAETQASMAAMNGAAVALSDRMAQLAALAEENSASAEEMQAATQQVASSATDLQQVGRESVAALGQVEAAVTELTGVVRALGRTTAHLAEMSGQLERR